MAKSPKALAKIREEQMLSRMEEMLGWDNEDEVRTALQRLGLIPGEDRFEEALAIWRDQH
jgi:hypothetical protein